MIIHDHAWSRMIIYDHRSHFGYGLVNATGQHKNHWPDSQHCFDSRVCPSARRPSEYGGGAYIMFVCLKVVLRPSCSNLWHSSTVLSKEECNSCVLYSFACKACLFMIQVTWPFEHAWRNGAKLCRIQISSVATFTSDSVSFSETQAANAKLMPSSPKSQSSDDCHKMSSCIAICGTDVGHYKNIKCKSYLN